MKKHILSIAFSLLLVTGSTWAQEIEDLTRIKQLGLSESQVQTLFSIFLSRAPMLLGDSVDTEQLIKEVAPQALQVLNSEQRRMLSELSPQEGMQRFGTMSKEQRTRYVFDSAKQLVHPSKQEWLRRMEEMTR